MGSSSFNIPSFPTGPEGETQDRTLCACSPESHNWSPASNKTNKQTNKDSGPRFFPYHLTYVQRLLWPPPWVSVPTSLESWAFGVFRVRPRDWTASKWSKRHTAQSLASPSPSLACA